MIVAIALISIIPFGLAWYYARHPELITARSNYGNLFIPPRPIDLEAMLRQPLLRGEELPSLRGRWLLLQLTPGPCAETCAATLHKTHQTRLMLNKETLRVRRLLVLATAAPAESLGGLLERDEDLVAVVGPPELIQRVTAALGHAPAADTVLLMDPLGNLVLWYAPDFDPYLLLKDLKHLLKASQIG